MTLLNLGLVKGEGGSSYIADSTHKRGVKICDYCTVHPHCELTATTSCKLFIPPLNFNTPKGLEKAFSTIRMGAAWSRRVKRRSIVGLVQVSPFKRIGLARVVLVQSGDLDTMLNVAIDTHHLFRDTVLPRDQAIEKLRKIVRNSYGSFAYEAGQQFTVLTCKRLSPDDCKGIKDARSLADQPGPRNSRTDKRRTQAEGRDDRPAGEA